MPEAATHAEDSEFRAALRRKELLRELALREMRSRYRGTALGQLWSLINPVAAMCVYTLVFGVLLHVRAPAGEPSGIHVFALWVLCGLLPWTLLARTLEGGTSVLVANAPLIQKVWFPRSLLVVALSASWAVTFLAELVVVVVALVVAGHTAAPLVWAMLALPLVALLSAFCCGIALILSILNVYFRDTTQALGIGMQIWFYATPVVYPISLVPQHLRRIYGLNPMERFVACFRSLLYDGRAPRWQDAIAVVLATAASSFFGWRVFGRFQRRLVEEL